MARLVGERLGRHQRWRQEQAAAPGFIELYEGRRVDFLPLMCGGRQLYERHPDLASLDFEKPSNSLLTVKPEDLPRDLLGRRLFSPDHGVITEYFEKRLMWDPVTELEAANIPWISYPFCVPEAPGEGRLPAFTHSRTQSGGPVTSLHVFAAQDERKCFKNWGVSKCQPGPGRTGPVSMDLGKPPRRRGSRWALSHGLLLCPGEPCCPSCPWYGPDGGLT